jgi:hypothetical protein
LFVFNFSRSIGIEDHLFFKTLLKKDFGLGLGFGLDLGLGIEIGAIRMAQVCCLQLAAKHVGYPGATFTYLPDPDPKLELDLDLDPDEWTDM